MSDSDSSSSTAAAADIPAENEIIQIQRLQNRVNELTALLYRLTDQFETDFFTYSSAFMNNQNISRQIKSRLIMTPEVWDIVNKSRETQESSNQSMT